ncbi:PIR protein, partial [Plasmodium ovale]
MSPKVNSTDFYKLFSNSSKELISEKFYEAMNNDSSDLSKYENECNDIHVHNPKDEMKKICKKYLRYLEYCKLLHAEKYQYDVSILFNYWLYGILTLIYGANSTEKIRTGFSALQLKWGYYNNTIANKPYYIKCKPELSMVDHEDWDKRKKLYDYYVDYDTLSTMAKTFDDDCEYYKKIEEKMSLYEHFDEQCLLDNDNCPNFYDKCKPYNPDSVLSQLPCHEKITREQDDAKAAERSAAMQHTSGSEQDTEVGPLGSSAPGLASGSEIEVKSETSQIGTKVGQSVLGITPVLLTASALYR